MQLEAEIEQLETKLNRLKALANDPETSMADTDVGFLEQPQQEKFKKSVAKRERLSKTNIIGFLDGLSLKDQNVEDIELTENVNLEMSFYKINRRHIVAKQAGTYLVAEQITYDDKRDNNRGRAVQYLIHPDLTKILRLEADGVLPNLGKVNLEATIPMDWGHSIAESNIQAIVESVRAQRMLKMMLSLVPKDDLEPVIYKDGRVDNYKLISGSRVELADGLSLTIYAIYNQDTQRNGQATIELDYTMIRLTHDGEMLEQYLIHAQSLEVRSTLYGSYDQLGGNQRLHDKAEALTKLAEEAINSKG